MSKELEATVLQSESGFTATQWVIRNSRTTTATGKLISVLLADRWRPGGEVFLKVKTLQELSNLKSKQAVLNALEDIENAGEWAIIRREGRSSLFVPMFVEGADEELLKHGIQQRETRKALDQNHKEVARQRGSKETQGYDSEGASAEGKAATTSNDPRVKSARDQEVLDQYLRARKDRNDPRWHNRYPLPSENFPVVNFLSLAAANQMIDEGNPRGYFLKGAHDWFEDEMAVQLMIDYGHLFGPSVTYSAVEDAFAELVAPDPTKHKNTPMDMDEAYVAMRLLASKGRMPDAGFVKRFMFADPNELNEDQIELRYIVHNTVRGIRETRRLSDQNFYQTWTVSDSSEAKPSTVAYSDKL